MARPYDLPSAASAARRGAWTGLDQASVMGLELLAGILTWAGLGWLADRWLGTTPWLFGVGAMLGFAAGLYLVWVRSGRHDAAEAPAGLLATAPPRTVEVDAATRRDTAGGRERPRD